TLVSITLFVILTEGLLPPGVGNSVQAAPTATFDLRIRAHCHTYACGYKSSSIFVSGEEVLRNAMLANIETLNRIWQPNNISFRPAGGDLEDFLVITYNDKFSTKTSLTDPEANELETTAANEPEVITLFLLEEGDGCGSRGPNLYTGFICSLEFPVEAW